MKKIFSLIVVLCFSAALWGQERPDALMWFDSGMLFYGDKSANITSDSFDSTVRGWKVGRVHIAVSAQTTPEMVSRLIMGVPFPEVSYSLSMDKDRIAASSATERYRSSLPQTEGISYVSADTKPLFVDGKMEEWVKKMAGQLYPRECWENGIQGRVLVQFTIDEQGRTGNVKILKGVEPQLDKVAERIILSMPDWKPARDADGNPVKVTYNLPIVFKHQ